MTKSTASLICLSLFYLLYLFLVLSGVIFCKQKMTPHTLSNILEQIFKFIIVIAVLPILLKYGTIVAVCGYILINIISEIISIIIFIIFTKRFTIQKKDIKPDPETIKEILAIGLPSVGGRIIGNIGFSLNQLS